MAKIKGEVKIAIEVCKGCELCVYECPQETLSMSEELNQRGYHYTIVVQDNCTGCTNCALVCPDAAIMVYRERRKKKPSIAEVYRETEDMTVTIDGR